MKTKITTASLTDSVMLSFCDYEAGLRAEVWLDEEQRADLVRQLTALAPLPVIAEETHLPTGGGGA